MNNFNQAEARNFVSELMSEIFCKGKIERIKDFYHLDVIGHFNNENIYFSDIEQRVIALQKNTKNFHAALEGCFVINELILFCVKQTWLNSKDDDFNDSTVFGLYRMKDRKVAEIWIILDRKVNSYKEINANYYQEMRLFSLEEKTKADFLRLLKSAQDSAKIDKSVLSRVEEECLYYYFHGFSAKETAIMMGISFRTVQTYIANIKERFNCNTKLELRKKLFLILANK